MSLVGVWCTFLLYGKENPIPSIDSLQSLSLGHPSKGLRWQLRWSCQEQSPCPQLSGYPDLTVSQQWLDSVSHELAALPKHTGLPQYAKQEERLNSAHPSHALVDYTLTMHDQSDQKRRFRIGRYNPLLQSYYLFEISSEEELAKGEVGQRAQFYLVTENLFQQLAASQEEILERALFPHFPSSELIESCIVMPVGKSPLHLVQQDGVWTINDTVADPPFVEALLKSIKSLRFSGIASSQGNPQSFISIIIQYGTQNTKRKTELIRIFREMGSAEQYYLQPGDNSTLFHLEALPRMISHVTEEMFLR